MPKVIRLTIEKYTVIGAGTGYQVQRGGVRVFNHASANQQGRLSESGHYDPRTNAQRGVRWLKNNGLVDEDAQVEEGAT